MAQQRPHADQNDPVMSDIIQLMKYFVLFQNETKTRAYLKIAIHTSLLTILSFGIIPQFALLFSNGYNIFEKAEALAIAIPVLKEFIKVFNRVWTVDKFWDFYNDLQILHETNARRSERKAKIQDKSAQVRMFIKYLVWLYVFLFFVFQIVPLIFVAIFLMLGYPIEPHLPFKGEYFIDASTNPAFGIIYASQVIAAASSVYYGVLDVIFPASCISVLGQVQLLKSDFMDIVEGHDDETVVSDGAVEHLAGEKSATNEVIEIDTDDASKEFCKLKNCAKRHVAVIGIVKKFEDVFSVHLATECLNVSIIGCLAMFQVTQSSELSAKLEYFMMAVFTYATLYIQIHLGQMLLNESALLERAVWALPWPDRDMRYRRVVTLVLQRAQIPLSITGMKLYKISAETFLGLLKSGYSFFALLQTVALE